MCRDSIGLRASSGRASVSLGQGSAGDKMVRLLFCLAMLLMLPAPVQAQKRGAQEPTAEEIQRRRDAEALDRQYKSTLKRTQQDTAPVRNDPWQNMRGSDNVKR